MTVTIVRPSIVGAAFKEPVPGWVQNITASTALFLLSGIGLVKYIHGRNSQIGCIVPVDIVTNIVITSSVFTANH